MARIDTDALQDPTDIYLASSLREARRVEDLLTTRGVDYAVAVEPLGRSILFGSVRHGAMFYVTAGQAAFCRSLLIQAGFTRGVVAEEGREEPPA